MRKHHFDKTSVVNGIHFGSDRSVVRADNPEAKFRSCDDGGQKPCLRLPLLGRMREISVSVVGPSSHLLVVDRFLDRGEKRIGLISFEAEHNDVSMRGLPRGSLIRHFLVLAERLP